MRIFISLTDESGSPRTLRLNLFNCGSTTALITEICREIGAKRNHTIIKLKYQPYNLRVVDGWPMTHYPIKHGSAFIIQFNEKYKYQDLSQSTQPLSKIHQQQHEEDLSRSEQKQEISFISSKSDKDDLYLQDCLKRMLEAVQGGDLEKIANILKEEPEIENSQELNNILIKKHNFLLNELGQNGKNALHVAIQRNNIDIVSFLLIKGASPVIVTIDDYTPLQLSISYKCSQIAKILLEQVLTDINQISNYGTALHFAVIKEDANFVQTLLANEADVEMTNIQGKKPIQICKNQRIKHLLQKKINMVKSPAPSITRGIVSKVSSFTKRLKIKVMLLNPFKQELVFQNSEHQVQNKYPINAIKQVEEVEEKSWLMSDSLYYFSINLNEKENTSIMIALKNQKTYFQWIKNINNAITYVQNSIFNKPVPINQQTIQLIDDDKNQITLHKRKTNEKPRPKEVNMSIMNLRLSNSAKEPNYFLSVCTPEKNETNNNSSICGSVSPFNQSTIVLGSIIRPQNSDQTSQTYQPISVFEETFIQPIQTETKSMLQVQNFKFRKNSEKIEYISQTKKQQKLTISFHDFQILKLLGNGSFGKVYLAKHAQTNKIYALKVLNKKKLMVKKQLKYAVSEANILKKVDSPFIIKLYYSFQTPLNLYMALDNCTNGDLAELIIVKERLTEPTARMIIAQVILAVQYLHSKRIIYRDMKPENILIASDGYIRLTDFGLSKQNNFSMSFCGSPAYLSPEMLQKKGVGFESDIYGVGTVLYEMVVGDPPFFDQQMQTMFDNIRNGKLKYPSYLSIEIKSFISKLLERDPTKRLGCKDMNDIKKHDFFKGLDWNNLAKKKLPVPNEMFANEQDHRSFQPVNLQQKQKITIDDTDYSEGENMLNRVNNFTFARDNPALHKQKSKHY